MWVGVVRLTLSSNVTERNSRHSLIICLSFQVIEKADDNCLFIFSPCNAIIFKIKIELMVDRQTDII